MIGTHKARAKEWGFGLSSNGGEQIAIMFEITEGEFAGRTITWYGYFTDRTTDRTLESMRHCGWESDSIEHIDDLNRNEVEIVIAEETYEGKTRPRVQFVNRPARVMIKNPLAGAALKAFAAQMRGKAVASKQAYGSQSAASPARQLPGTARARTQQNEYEDPGAPDDGVPY